MVYCVNLLLITLAMTHAWNFKANVDYITPRKTNNVQLVCTQDNNQNSGQDMKTISGIRITKMDYFGTKETFAEIHDPSSESWSRDTDVNVEASMNQVDGAYLKVTWPVANEDTEGAYGCDIYGYNALDNHVTVNVRPSVKIKRKILTEDDVTNLIQKLTQSHVEKQKELEHEIASLRKLLNENLQSTRQDIRKTHAEIKSNLSVLQNTIESTCSTKSELKDHVSELKNFTVNQILAAKNHNKRELDQLSSILQNTSSTFEKQLSGMAQNLSTFKVHLTSGFDSLSKKDNDLSSRVSSTSNSLTRQIHSVDTKYGGVTRQLNSEFTRKISELERKCPCTTPAPTTTTPKPTPKPVIVSDWPEGNYALIRPATGCANLDALESTGRSLFKTIPYAGTGFENVKRGVDKVKEFKLIIGSGSNKIGVNFCVKDTSIPSLSSPQWPKGTYCTALVDASTRCPRGFGYSFFTYHFKDGNKELGAYRMKFCCRADQRANVPIKLPNTRPFYLYRYKGTCQQVEGMTVTNHLLEVKAKKWQVNYPAKHPDATKSKDPISMCYYQPPCPAWCPTK